MIVNLFSFLSHFGFLGVNFPGFPGVPVSYMIPSVAYPVGYGANGIGGKYLSNKVRISSVSYRTKYYIQYFFRLLIFIEEH